MGTLKAAVYRYEAGYTVGFIRYICIEKYTSCENHSKYTITGSGHSLGFWKPCCYMMRVATSFILSQIKVTSHFRKAPVTGNAWNAMRSCHMIGHAIDMNLLGVSSKRCRLKLSSVHVFAVSDIRIGAKRQPNLA